MIPEGTWYLIFCVYVGGFHGFKYFNCLHSLPLSYVRQIHTSYLSMVRTKHYENENLQNENELLKDQIEAMAKLNPNVQKFIEGQAIKKMIVVPNKLIKDD